jgi:hypothetical protein
MHRTSLLRGVTGLAAAIVALVALENCAAAHCLGGQGIYNCCCRQAAACSDASCDDCQTAPSHHVARSSYRSNSSSRLDAKPVIHRTRVDHAIETADS